MGRRYGSGVGGVAGSVIRGGGDVVRRWLAIGAMASILWALLTGPVLAHSGEESHVYLTIFDNTIEGRVEYPIADFNEIFGVDIPEDPVAAVSVLEDVALRAQSYTEQHLTIGKGDDPWPLVFEGFDTLPTGNGLYILLPFVVDIDFGGDVPREFNVSYDAVLESKPDRSAFLIIENDWRSGTFKNEGTPLLRFTADETTRVVSLGEQSWTKALAGVVGLGVEHIQIGSDHIFFILALVLPAVLIYTSAKGWQPARSFGSSLWRVTKIATSFTVAHTITLTLGGLGIVQIPPSIVEPIIAISIALAALHNIRPVLFNSEWMIAFGFGLFHGFGFAGLLGDLGLDRSNRLISLLGFNLGIELGQVAIILLLFPALFILRRVRSYVPLMKAASGVLMLAAFGWFVDRVFGLDVGVDRVVDVLLAWPRPLWIVVLVTLVAIGYYKIEASAGRLVPLEGDKGGSPDLKEAVSV